MEPADEIEADILEAAMEKNPGVSPGSVALSERERIAYNVIARWIERAGTRPARLDGHQVVRTRPCSLTDDGA